MGFGFGESSPNWFQLCDLAKFFHVYPDLEHVGGVESEPSNRPKELDFVPQDQLQAATDRVLRGEKSLSNMAIYADRFDVETLGPGMDDPGAAILLCAWE